MAKTQLKRESKRESRSFTKRSPTLLELKTVTLSSKGQIALPKSLRTRQKLRDGDKLALLVYEDCVEIRPLGYLASAVDLTKKGVYSSLMTESALAKRWKTPEEDEAWKDL